MNPNNNITRTSSSIALAKLSSSAATPTTPRTPRTPTPKTPLAASIHINSSSERSAWLAYLLERLLAHRRALTKEEGKEAWMARHLGEWARVAFLCVGDDDDLKAMCDNLRQKHGSGAEEETLRALARAALRAYDVETPNEPATHRIVAGLNDFIVAAAKHADEVRTFAQVRAVFASAGALRKLASEVSTGAAVLYDLFDEFERVSTTPAGGRKGAVSRAGSRRVASGLVGRAPLTPLTPRTPRTPM
ncbi:hypothetical protein PG993_011743 [Apiospora rasikravindrae]|uniref:Uncharacterized protein n=1 Tax=Apiospora rasikravindrae TaxID=990691 RepID=A0ABR1S1T4_9PEZI